MVNIVGNTNQNKLTATYKWYRNYKDCIKNPFVKGIVKCQNNPFKHLRAIPTGALHTNTDAENPFVKE